jgi:hypothetical protein
VQAELFNTYCCSFYGSLLLPHRRWEKLCVIWRKSLRSVWRLPTRTHCDIVAGLMDSLCPTHALMTRFLKFAVCVLNHEVPEILYAFRCFRSAKLSLFGANVQWCQDHLVMSSEEFMGTEICLCEEDALSVQQ